MVSDQEMRDREDDPLGVAGLLMQVAVAATEAADTDEVLKVALEEVCTLTGWPVGHAYIHVEDSAQLLPSLLWHLDDPEAFDSFRRVTNAQRIEPGEGLPGRVLVDGTPHWIRDVTKDRNFPRAEHARAAGLKAGFAFPVPTRDGIAAVLEFFSSEVAEPDESLLAVMATVGSQLGRVFERVRASAELQEREERFRSLAQNAADALVTIDESDRIIFANPACERVFGYTQEELARLPFTRLMPERLRDRHRQGLQRHARTGERRLQWDGMELPGLHKDGHEIPLEVTFGTFEREGRHLYTGIMRDISDRKRAEEERARLLEAERAARGEAERRAEQEAALREAAAAVASAFTAEETVIRIARSALVATRADGAFVERISAEDGQVEVVATAGDRVPRLGVRSPYQGSFVERVVESEQPDLIPRLSESDRPVPEHLRDACADCAAAVIPLLNAGEPVGALILLRDPAKAGFRDDELERASTFGELAALAFRKIHLLEEAERRTEELQRVMDSRNRLMRGFSHDVKNPMGAADGFLQLLEDGISGPLNEAQGERLRRARGALSSAMVLIDDLLAFARAESGDIEVRVAPTDVREAAREVTGEYMAQAEARDQILDLDVPPDFPVLESDPARVRQVIANLVSNAVKYTPKGGRIRVGASTRESEDGGRAMVTVRDNGPGVPGELREALFEEFTRLDPDAADGAGVGLAISRRIARALGGDIELESEPDRGSTFTLWLPLIRPGETPTGSGSGSTGA